MQDYNYFYELFKNESTEKIEETIFYNEMLDFMNHEKDKALNDILKERGVKTC